MSPETALPTVARAVPFSETPDIETSSEDYATRFAGPVGEWFLQVQQENILRMIMPWPAATVLEVGGGHGQLTGCLVQQGYQVTVVGSDASCQKRIQPFIKDGRCRFHTGNLLKLPYPARAFDVVVSVRLLPHVAAWEQLVGELCRVARTTVVVDYPTLRSLNLFTPALFSTKRQLEGNTRPYQSFHDSQVVAAFAQAGFKLAARRPQFFLPMVLHRTLRIKGISQALEGGCRTAQLTRLFGSPVIALFTRSGR